MTFVYMGFDPGANLRRYRFDRIIEKGVRKRFVVMVDVGLLTKHHVRLQDAPAICLRMLQDSEVELQESTIGEEWLSAYAKAKTAEDERIALKRPKRPSRPVNPGGLGSAWR